MNIIWEIGEPDIIKVKDLVNAHNNPIVENRINRNVNRIGIHIDRDAIIKTMLMCLLSAQQDTNPDSDFELFFRKKPFLLTYEFLSKATIIEVVLDDVLKINGLTKHSKKITNYFTSNFSFLEGTNWALQRKLENSLENESTKQSERDLADNVDKTFKGFGSKQARNFLQSLGLTKYEIPIDSRMMNWMKDFDFPIKFSPNALQDRAFYHFISDGIQLLCEKADIYPCILDAVIFSSEPEINRTKENSH